MKSLPRYVGLARPRAAASLSSSASLPRTLRLSSSARGFGLFSSPKGSSDPPSSPSSSSASSPSDQTQLVRVKGQGERAPVQLESSTGARSPAAAYHNLSDAEYFDSSRPLRWLLAMDFSPNAWRALKGVKQLMRPERGDQLTIFAVPVLSFVDLADDSTAYHGVDVVREAVDQCVEAMKAVHEECRDLMGCYTCEVSEPAGDPREIVLMRLERKGEGRIDYAVCGQRGKSRILNILLGSVASHLANYAPTSVVIVK